jgi:hypothetical protein
LTAGLFYLLDPSSRNSARTSTEGTQDPPTRDEITPPTVKQSVIKEKFTEKKICHGPMPLYFIISVDFLDLTMLVPNDVRYKCDVYLLYSL